MPPLQFGHGDILATHSGASGGWGDPIERDPEAILTDVSQGWIDPEIARTCYGVIVRQDGETWVLDGPGTDAERKEIRRRRLEETMSAEEFWRDERELHLSGGLIDPLKYMYSRTVSETDDFEAELREFFRLGDTVCW